MNDVPFHLTVMGKKFIDVTVPALVEAIERLNGNVERLTPLAPVFSSAPSTPPAPAPKPARDGCSRRAGRRQRTARSRVRLNAHDLKS